VIPDLDLIAVYEGYKQNSYGKTSCSDASASTCSGTENSAAILLDYRLSKRFDVYLGSLWSQVEDGLAAGFELGNTSTVTTTMGLRFKF